PAELSAHEVPDITDRDGTSAPRLDELNVRQRNMTPVTTTRKTRKRMINTLQTRDAMTVTQLSPRPQGLGRSARVLPSDVKAELDDVAVLHDVVLALDASLARRAGGRDRAGRDQVVVGDDLGLDEALLEVGVDHAGRLGGGRADRDLPGAGLLR